MIGVREKDVVVYFNQKELLPGSKYF
jgi:hypothetical protein